MSRDATVTFEWGDGEHTFRLAIGQLRELEEKTNTGPLALFMRLMDGSWRVDDLREIIRLGLIGGGSEPTKALNLVKRYVDERPKAENVTPAKLIMGAALWGSDREPLEGNGEAARDETTAGSPLPPTTQMEPLSEVGHPSRSTE